MASPLYEFSIVPFKRTLKNLMHIMNKAEQHAKEKGENVEDYIQAQIYPDMKNFGYQIQRLSDTSKFCLVRVAGVDSASVAMEDNETTWAEYKARVQKTLDALENADPKAFDGKENTEISLFNGKWKFTGTTYLQNFAIPNFYFHVTTAYDLLRMKGVPVGKTDYLAGSEQS